jgi:hypothetical protein
LKIFIRQCPVLKPGISRSARLMALGAHLWREKLRAQAPHEPARAEKTTEGGNGPAATDGGESEAAEPEKWTPDRVARRMRSIVRAAAFQVRKARWFLRLSESMLIWQDAVDPAVRHVLLLRHGRAEFLDPSTEGGLGPDFTLPRRASPELRQGFDIDTYDRMRVLTTEIRRLLQEGRPLELRVPSDTRLSSPQLKKMLPWI